MIDPPTDWMARQAGRIVLSIYSIGFVSSVVIVVVLMWGKVERWLKRD